MESKSKATADTTNSGPPRDKKPRRRYTNKKVAKAESTNGNGAASPSDSLSYSKSGSAATTELLAALVSQLEPLTTEPLDVANGKQKQSTESTSGKSTPSRPARVPKLKSQKDKGVPPTAASIIEESLVPVSASELASENVVPSLASSTTFDPPLIFSLKNPPDYTHVHYPPKSSASSASSSMVRSSSPTSTLSSSGGTPIVSNSPITQIFDNPTPNSTPVEGILYRRPSEISPRGTHHHESFIEVDAAGMHIHHEDGHQRRLSGMGGSEHTIEIEECAAFSVHINNILKDDPLVARHLPLVPESNDLFDKLGDGLILAALLNAINPGVIDLKKLNKQPTLNVFQCQENLNLCVNAASSLGCHVVNIGAKDIADKKEVLVLGLIWQIIRIQLTSTVSLPDPMKSSLDADDLTASANWTPEQILIGWVNYNLESGGHVDRITNFASDFKDPTILGKVMIQLKRAIPHRQEDAARVVDLLGPEPSLASPRNTESIVAFARQVLICAGKEFGVNAFIQPQQLVSGKNARLVLGFVAQLFNAVNNSSNNFYRGLTRKMSATTPRSGSNSPLVESKAASQAVVVDNGAEAVDDNAITPPTTPRLELSSRRRMQQQQNADVNTTPDRATSTPNGKPPTSSPRSKGVAPLSAFFGTKPTEDIATASENAGNGKQVISSPKNGSAAGSPSRLDMALANLRSVIGMQVIEEARPAAAEIVPTVESSVVSPVLSFPSMSSGSDVILEEDAATGESDSSDTHRHVQDLLLSVAAENNMLSLEPTPNGDDADDLAVSTASVSPNDREEPESELNVSYSDISPPMYTQYLETDALSMNQLSLEGELALESFRNSQKLDSSLLSDTNDSESVVGYENTAVVNVEQTPTPKKSPRELKPFVAQEVPVAMHAAPGLVHLSCSEPEMCGLGSSATDESCQLAVTPVVIEAAPDKDSSELPVHIDSSASNTQEIPSPPLPSCVSVPNIRLLQHRPAWGLHLMLRVLGFPYSCENVNSPIALGMELPVLVVDSDVVRDHDAWSYLSKQLEDAKTAAGLKGESHETASTLTGSLTTVTVTNTTVESHKTIITQSSQHSTMNSNSTISSTKIATSIDDKEDRLLGAYLETSLVQPLYQLQIETGEYLAQEDRARLFDVGRTIASWLRLDRIGMAFLKDRFERNASVDVLLRRLQAAYQLVNAELVKNAGYLLNPSVHKHKRSAADCILFHHIANALATPQVADSMYAHVALMEYFNKLKYEYFSNPVVPLSTVQIWKDAVVILQNNKFLSRPLPLPKTHTEMLLQGLVCLTGGSKHDEVAAMIPLVPRTVQPLGYPAHVWVWPRISINGLLRSMQLLLPSSLVPRDALTNNIIITKSNENNDEIGIGGAILVGSVLTSFGAYVYFINGRIPHIKRR